MRALRERPRAQQSVRFQTKKYSPTKICSTIFESWKAGEGIKVRALTIKNFRGIKTGTVHFTDHSALIGPGNCGKTTVIEALALLLGRDRLVRNLTEHDFYGGNPKPGDRIELSAVITGFAKNDPDENPDWFRPNRGVPQWYSPRLKTTSAVRDHDHTELCVQLCFTACFNIETLTVETLRFFQDDSGINPFLDDSVVPVPVTLLASIGFFLVPASRTWERTISFSSELFRRVIAQLSSLPAEALLSERDRLRAPNPALETHDRLADLVGRVNREMGALVPDHPELRFRLTATDSDSLLQALVPHFQIGDRPPLPAGRHGTGLVSLQTLLLLMEFGRLREQRGEGFFLAFEEPELHVPPGLQRRLIHRVQAIAEQSIITSHAPTAAAYYEGTNIIVLQNKNGSLEAVPFLSSALKSDATNVIRKLFVDNRRETLTALMSEILLVPEGRLDYEWLNRLVEITETQEGWQESLETIPFGTSVGVIPTHEGRVRDSVQALLPLHGNIVALVDGDAAGDAYVAELLASPSPPHTIIQWRKDWTIETAIAWILEANDNWINELGEIAGKNISDRQTANSLLRRKVEDGGIKDDLIAHERIGALIRINQKCLARARLLLSLLRNAAVSRGLEELEGITVDNRSTSTIPVRIFDPLCCDSSKATLAQAKRSAS